MGNAKNFVDATKMGGNEATATQTPSSIQSEYPLLKPVTFTNTMEDDYVESLVWNLKS